MKKNPSKRIINFIFFLFSSYVVIALGMANLLIHINFFELIKDKGIGLLISSFLPAISILVLGLIELCKNRRIILKYGAILLIILSLIGITTTVILTKLWELKDYILWISIFILGLNRLVFGMINSLPQWMILGVVIVVLTGGFYCISGVIFLVTGLPLLILGINELRIINLKSGIDTISQWIFFSFLVLIGAFIISFGIQESKIRVEWEVILSGLGIILISILFFFLTTKLKLQKAKKVKAKSTFKLILQIISFIFFGLAIYLTLLAPILTQIYYEVVQGVEKWEMIGSLALVTSILGCASLLLSAMIGIKTYKSSLGIFIFSLLGTVYIYLLIINLNTLFLLALPLFICLLSIFVLVKKEGLKPSRRYQLTFLLTSFISIIIITLIIQYYEFKMMDNVIEDIVNKISTQGPNVSRIARCKKALERYDKFSQNLLWRPYAGKLTPNIDKLKWYLNKYLLDVKAGKYPSYYVGAVHNRRFSHEEIRILKNLCDKFSFEYECIVKADKKIIMNIHGLTDGHNKLLKYTPLGYYPKLSKGRYPKHTDEVIINSLTGIFDKDYFHQKKNDLIILSCKVEEVGKEIILFGKRYKIVGISDKLTNYRDIYLPYFEAKRLTEKIKSYDITEYDGIVTIVNTMKEVEKIKSGLEELNITPFDGMLD